MGWIHNSFSFFNQTLVKRCALCIFTHLPQFATEVAVFLWRPNVSWKLLLVWKCELGRIVKFQNTSSWVVWNLNHRDRWVSVGSNQVVWAGRGETWSLKVSFTPFSVILKDEKCYPRKANLVSRFVVKVTSAQRRENDTGNKTFGSWIRTLNISPSVFHPTVLNVFPYGSFPPLFFSSGVGTKYHGIKEASVNHSPSKRFLIICLEQQNLQCIIFLTLIWRNSEFGLFALKWTHEEYLQVSLIA